MTRTIHLVDRLDAAAIDAPSAGHVQVQPMDVGGVQRTAIFCHPDAAVRFALEPQARDGARLRFACGIKSVAWERLGGPVHFRVVSAGRAVWEIVLDPRGRAEHRRWVEGEVALEPAAELALETAAEHSAYAWAGWADPVLELATAEQGAARSRRRAAAPAHVIVVTADAMRADALTDPATAVPHLDALAAGGLRFSSARSASVTTPGSYATLLTGLPPQRHGVLAEWDALPAHLPTLATETARAGWHTVFAPSERELGDPGAGFARVFAETVECLGNPSQEGAVTTRRLLERLERADEPLFVWAHYFDAHPPQPLPPERVARHYDGDPRDPDRTHQPEIIGAIRGSETLFYVDAALPGLREGRVDARLVSRLRRTALALLGTPGSAPDIATHLRALGPEARLGLEAPAFGRWLLERAEELRRGVIDPALVGWLDDLRVPLRAIERESVAWLDGVVDVRYPLAHVRAAAETVDAQVGAIVEFLRDSGLYDEATVVFTTPHGELYGEGGNWFQHHVPLEPVLRVPIVVKPPERAGLRAREVEGTFELTDLAATLLDLLGLDPPRNGGGASRLTELRAGGPLAPRDAVALGVDAMQACLVRGDLKLVRTLGDIPLPDGSWALAGSNRWFDLAGGGEQPCEPPPEAAALVTALEHRLSGRHPR